MKNLGEYHLKIYKLDLTHFLTAFGLAWQAALKKTKIKLDLLTDNGMLLMVEICKYVTMKYVTLFFLKLITNT